MSKKSARWIWYRGDYELYHSLLFHARREEYGVHRNCFWNLSAPFPRVNFKKEFYADTDTVINVRCNGFSEVLIDDVRYSTNTDISVSSGNHTVEVYVLKAGGLPAIYVSSPYLITDSTWRVSTVSHGTEVWAGDSPAYYEEKDDPEVFRFSYERIAWSLRERRKNGYLFDFSRETFAKLVVENADSSKPVSVYYGESVEEALGGKEALLRETVCGSDSYTLISRAFRYIYIESECAEQIRLHALYEYLPLENIGSFRCDSELVNKIYDVSAYTFHLNSREFLIDGIKRDRWVWSGDAYQSFMINSYLCFDPEITKRTIIALLGKPPYTSHINTINDYSYYLIISVYEYYFTTGDIEFAEFVFERVKALYDFCYSRLDGQGLVCEREGDWIFIDWSDMDKGGPIAAEQILFWQATKAMARLSELLGLPFKEYESFADSMQETIMKLFWSEEKGAFIDCAASGKNNVTRHANIFAILYDFVDADKQKLIKETVLDSDEVTQITTPYFNFFQLLARCKLGDIPFMQRQIEEYWGGMIALGATSIWEEYDPESSGEAHYGMYGMKYGKSLCHAWGSGPVYMLGRYCLGVQPEDVAYKSFRIRPCLGSYKCVEGTVPLPDGKVDISLVGDMLTLTCTAEGGYVVQNGVRIDIPAGKTVTMKYIFE